jgi:cytochrome c553
MKRSIIGMLSIIVWVAFFCSPASAAGDVKKGKALFNDPKLGGGTAGVSCNSCHQQGKGMEKAADMKDIEGQVNACIENALKGKGIDPNSPEMADIVAYIRSFKGKTPAKGTSEK